MKKHNFSAGPSILANSVIKEASKSVSELNNVGLSLLEISHRSQNFIDIINEAKELIKKLLKIPNNYEVLFLQGGASLQFHMTALNFLKKNGGGYIDTGIWSKKAIKEAQKVGQTNVFASSSDNAYRYIPKTITIDKKVDYIHFTSNNTIYGTQFHDFSNILDKINAEKLICDMSSDIFSRKINVADFDLIYAGAQKNLGPAGTTLIIINKDAVSKNDHLPTYLNYNTHIDKESMFNTPPVFPIYVAMLTLRWIDKQGGVDFIQEKNEIKAKMMYEEIDRNNLFSGYTKKEDRSLMNATFSIKNDNFKNQFEKMCNEAGINGIKGHRSVGGYRASMYNALDIESVGILTDIMKQIEKKA